VSADGAARLDLTLRLWGWRAGRLLYNAQVQTASVRFSRDGRLLGVGLAGDKLQLFEVSTGAYRTLVRDSGLGRGNYESCAVRDDNRLLATRGPATSPGTCAP
jgi:hypothetical protein